MNQTTRPCRDPPGEQGNKYSSLKTAGVPGALGTRRNNVMVEFPLGLFQTGEETRSFQDLTPPQILLVIPFPSLSRHGEFGRRGEQKEKRECRSLGAPAESRTSSGLAALCGRRRVKRRRRGSSFYFASSQLPSQVADKLLSFPCPSACVTLPLNEMRGGIRAYLCMENEAH